MDEFIFDGCFLHCPCIRQLIRRECLKTKKFDMRINADDSSSGFLSTSLSQADNEEDCHHPDDVVDGESHEDGQNRKRLYLLGPKVRRAVDLTYRCDHFALLKKLEDAVLGHDREVSAQKQRRVSVWGAEEPLYVPSAEDKASLVARFTYTWIGDYIYRAAREELSTASLPPPTRLARTWNTGQAMSSDIHAMIDARRRWDVLCNVVLVSTLQALASSSLREEGARDRGEEDGMLVGRRQQQHRCSGVDVDDVVGVLRWVGYAQRSKTHKATRLLAGIEWTTISSSSSSSSSYSSASTRLLRTTTVSKSPPPPLEECSSNHFNNKSTDGHESVIVDSSSRDVSTEGEGVDEHHNDGVLGGETLFTTSTPGQRRCCVVPVEDVVLLMPTKALWKHFDEHRKAAAAAASQMQPRSNMDMKSSNNNKENDLLQSTQETSDLSSPSQTTMALLQSVQSQEPPKRPSLFRAILRVHWKLLLPQVPFKMLGDLMTLANPLILEQLVDFLQDDHPAVSTGVALVVVVFGFNLIQTFSAQKYYDMSIQSGLIVRSSFLGYIFEKCFTISQKSLTFPDMGVGRVVNMMSTDVERANDFCWYVLYLYSNPQQLFVSIGLLYRLVGWCALSGLAVMLITLPVQGYIAKKQQTLRMSLSKLTDKRVKLTTELLSGMRIVKFMAWEQEFVDRVQDVRREELLFLKDIQWYRVLTSLINVAAPTVVIATVLVLYHVTGHTLTARIVFPTISLLNLMRIPFMMLPFVITSFVQLFVALARITRFLECDDDKIANIQDPEAWMQQQQQQQDDNDDQEGKKTNKGGDATRQGRQTPGGEGSVAARLSSVLPSPCTFAVIFENASLAAYVPAKLPPLLGGASASDAGHLRQLCDRLRNACSCCDCCASRSDERKRRGRRQEDGNTSSAAASLSTKSHFSAATANGKDDRSSKGERQPLLSSTAEGTTTTTTTQRFMSTAAFHASTAAPAPAPTSTPADNKQQQQPTAAAKTTTGAPPPVKKGDEDVYELTQKILLNNITLRIPANKLTVIVGPTGCGKSTLLEAVLGQFDVVKGHVYAPSTTKPQSSVTSRQNTMDDKDIVTVVTTTATTSADRATTFSSLAYAPQQPWVMNASLKDNILFHTPFDADWFEEVLRVCELKADIATLVNGVDTEIGEKGVTLSGGQKARVGLARALYSRRQVYLLDDPLSALDAHVSNAIFDNCICSALSGTTRILCTHQTHVLSKADNIVVLGESGVVRFSGDYEAYLAHPTAAREMTTSSPLTAAQRSDSHGGPQSLGSNTFLSRAGSIQVAGRGGGGGDFPATENLAGGEGDESGEHRERRRRGGDSDDDDDDDVGLDGIAIDDPAGDNPTNEEDVSKAVITAKHVRPEGEDESGKLMSTEEKASGSVPWSTYVRYINAGGGTFVALMILVIFTFTETLSVSSSVWLSIWSDQAYGLSQDTYLYVFLATVSLSTLSSPLRFYFAYDAMRLASLNLHQTVLFSIASAPMRFFDTTPLGRIINRFSRDIDMCDNSLQMSFIFMLQTIFSAISTTAVMLASQPLALVVIVPCSFVYYRLMLFFNAANREVRRIASVIKSPMVALLTETLTGYRTIRAYGVARPMMVIALNRIDVVYSAGYMQNIANRWLATRIEVMGNLIITSVALLAVVGKLADFGSNNVGLVTLGFTMALSITQTMNWIVRQVAAVEADMNSVERLVYYTDNVPHEDIPELTSRMQTHYRVLGPPTRSRGVQFPEVEESSDSVAQQKALAHKLQPVLQCVDLCMRYRPGLPLVLKGLSFDIATGDKVAIVGRTGSGKSSLMLAFMRIVDIESGTLSILGKPHTNYDLHELRQLFAMIPQDPLLFDGTVRSNLDPFQQCTDAEIFAALKKVGMDKRLEADGLTAVVLEQGSNFSVGQRQLLCLARALLRRGSKIVLMDEATANIDPGLDQLIQNTVKTALQDFTVITIAHRLHTVLEYRTILVLDQGRVAEFGRPWDLVADKTSILRGMIASHGETIEAKLLKLVAKSRKRYTTTTS